MSSNRETQRNKEILPSNDGGISGRSPDANAQKRSRKDEMLIDLEREVLEFNAVGAHALEDTMDLMLSGLENILPGTMPSVVLMANDEKTIKVLSAPGLPKKYIKAINGLRIGPEEGSCGTAMFLKKMVVVSNIQDDPLWKNYRDLAAGSGLNACLSIPLLGTGGKVMGSFGMYSKEARLPSEDELRIVSRISHIARIIIENKLAEEKIHAAKERYDLISSATNDLIWDWDLNSDKVYRSRKGLGKVLGVADNAAIESSGAWIKRIHPEDKKTVKAALKHLFTTPDANAFEMEYRFRTDTGSFNHVYDRGFTLRDASGKVTRVVGAAQNINERKRLEQQLVEQEVNRQRLIAKATIEGQENERSEIGKELHDNINQMLTTSKLLLDLAMEDAGNAAALIDKSRQNISQAINEIRQISKTLVPPSIGDLGLKAAILEMTDMVQLSAGIGIDFRCKGKTDSLSAGLQLTLYRIIQEQINNIIKHARAEYIIVNIHVKQMQVDLLVEDNGMGFDPAKTAKGLGLRNISNRAEIFGGKVSIDSAPGKGCKVFVQLPLQRKSRNE